MKRIDQDFIFEDGRERGLQALEVVIERGLGTFVQVGRANVRKMCQNPMGAIAFWQLKIGAV